MTTPPRSSLPAVVLFVEDDVSVRETVGSMIAEACGGRVDVARNLTEAVALLDPERHQLVVSDDDLGDGSGLTWVREVRLTHPHIQIAAWSGGWSKREVQRLQAELDLEMILPKSLAGNDRIIELIRSLPALQ